MSQQTTQDDFSKIRVEAKASTIDMIIGPPVISAILAGLVTFLAYRVLGLEEEFDDHLHLLWIFPVLFFPLLFATIRYNLNRSRWRIEDGTVYCGPTPLFKLKEIEAVQIGLPDNWVTAIAEFTEKIPKGIRPKTGGIVYQAGARKHMLVIRLSDQRWMLWSGMQYKNWHAFRDALVSVAPLKQIDPLPISVLPLLRVTNVNRVLHE